MINEASETDPEFLDGNGQPFEAFQFQHEVFPVLDASGPLQPNT